MLENKFKTLCHNFNQDAQLIAKLWKEIQMAYTQNSRHYHTLVHLSHIYKELPEENLTLLLEFAIFYHDIIYNVRKNDNEEQSALLAQKHLALLNVPTRINEKVFQLIIETKSHKASNEENKLFLDADLSILGSNDKQYAQYIQNVRKEYAIYDDDSYIKGRKKVLRIFLKKEKVYESDYFYELYEKKARKNLSNELKQLDLL